MRRLLEIVKKSNRIACLVDLGHQKFSLAADVDDKDGMETVRNELHATLDSALDTAYELSKLRREYDEKMLKGMGE